MIRRKRLSSNRSLTNGGRNLVLLGVFSTIVALTTTGISLAIYHNSGDIYLDRSRPGYLPDEEEIEKDEVEEEEYDFGKIETLDIETIEVYLENLNAEARSLDEYSNSFSAGALSDEKLGITE